MRSGSRNGNCDCDCDCVCECDCDGLWVEDASISKAAALESESKKKRETALGTMSHGSAWASMELCHCPSGTAEALRFAFCVCSLFGLGRHTQTLSNIFHACWSGCRRQGPRFRRDAFAKVLSTDKFFVVVVRVPVACLAAFHLAVVVFVIVLFCFLFAGFHFLIGIIAARVSCCCWCLGGLHSRMPAVGVAAGVAELWPGPFDTTLPSREAESGLCAQLTKLRLFLFLLCLIKKITCAELTRRFMLSAD